MFTLQNNEMVRCHLTSNRPSNDTVVQKKCGMQEGDEGASDNINYQENLVNNQFRFTLRNNALKIRNKIFNFFGMVSSLCVPLCN